MKERDFPIQHKGFKKYERLKSKKLLGLLFSKGITVSSFPVKIIFHPIPEELNFHYPIQVLLSVSKRLHSKAHIRNKYKRLLKEAYRLEKQDFLSALSEKNLSIAVAFLYRNKEDTSLHDLREEVKKAFQQVLEKLNTA